MIPLTKVHLAVFNSHPAIILGDVPKLKLSYPRYLIAREVLVLLYGSAN